MGVGVVSGRRPWRVMRTYEPFTYRRAWVAYSSDDWGRYFDTHAEAIAYATVRARKDPSWKP